MSLSKQQKEDTRRELCENLERASVEIADIARDLGTSERYIGELLALEPRRLEDTWILRNYLLEAVRERGGEPVPFTALAGDWHNYWFLDGAYIDRGRIEG